MCNNCEDCKHYWIIISNGHEYRSNILPVKSNYWCKKCGAVKTVTREYKDGVVVDSKEDIFMPMETDFPTCASSYGAPWI